MTVQSIGIILLRIEIAAEYKNNNESALLYRKALISLALKSNQKFLLFTDAQTLHA